VADYRDHPGFLGYYLGDEPPAEAFEILAGLFAALRARDPDHPAWNNLHGRSAFSSDQAYLDYMRAYLERVKPAVLCNDHYEFLTSGDRGQFFENLAGLRALSSEYRTPFCVIGLLIQHGLYRHVTAGELRWQVSQALTFGANGIGYFTYWTPPADPQWNWQYGVIALDGQRTEYYDDLAAFDPAVRAAGITIDGLTWLTTGHAGSVPRGARAFAGDDWIAGVEGRAALGTFVDARDTPYVLVANSDSLAAQTITLAMRGTRGASRLGSWGTIAGIRDGEMVRVPLALEAGSFALLRIEGTFDLLRPGRLGPTLSLLGSPARAQARFELTRLAANARLELLDVGGRRVWSRALAPGRATIVWRGERDAGGAAPPGLYFARVKDARGVAATRVSWLGR
jgi:hypothetical protein